MVAVAVCGPAVADEGQAALAADVGRRLAEAACVLVCGGLGGVMEHAARGMRAARAAGSGGLVLGILPGEAASEANVWCDIVVPTGMGLARNVLVVRSADAVILLGGRSGTLSEAAVAWQLGKPVVALQGSGGWAERLAGEAIDDRRADHVMVARSPEDAVAQALAAIPP